jgi:hypothetical protein
MCVSDITGNNTSALTRTQSTMNAWSQFQARRRESRQGYRSVSHADNMTVNQEVNNNQAYTNACSNGAKCYGSVPTPIDTSETW